MFLENDPKHQLDAKSGLEKKNKSFSYSHCEFFPNSILMIYIKYVWALLCVKNLDRNLNQKVQVKMLRRYLKSLAYT